MQTMSMLPYKHVLALRVIISKINIVLTIGILCHQYRISCGNGIIRVSVVHVLALVYCLKACHLHQEGYYNPIIHYKGSCNGEFIWTSETLKPVFEAKTRECIRLSFSFITGKVVCNLHKRCLFRLDGKRWWFQFGRSTEHACPFHLHYCTLFWPRPLYDSVAAGDITRRLGPHHLIIMQTIREVCIT